MLFALNIYAYIFILFFISPNQTNKKSKKSYEILTKSKNIKVCEYLGILFIKEHFIRLFRNIYPETFYSVQKLIILKMNQFYVTLVFFLGVAA